MVFLVLNVDNKVGLFHLALALAFPGHVVGAGADEDDDEDEDEDDDDCADAADADDDGFCIN